MVVDPDIAYDLMSDNAWVDVSKYAKPEQMVKGELGKMHGMKFFESTNIKVVDSSDTASSKISVHIAFAYGKGAYSCVNLENGAGKPEIIVKENGSAGTADPLNQRATAGWKAAFTAVITEPLALVRVETGVKA